MKTQKLSSDLKKQLFDADVWPRIYRRVAPYWKLTVVALILVVIVAATKPVLALIMEPLLDEGFSGVKPHYVWSIPLVIVILMFVRGVASFGSDYLLALIANNMLRTMRADMFSKLLTLPDSYFK
ncbi:hypothetical protein E4695_15875, partial [Alcaligenaceae bacterium 429]